MPEPERDIIDITLRRSTRDTQIGYRAPTLSPQPKGPPKGVAPPPEYRFAVRRSGRPLYLTPTQRYMEEVAETPEGQRPETIPLTPDVEQELLKRGAPADVVGQFRQYGVPRDLLQQLPAPDRPGFLQRLLAFKPARYAAKGIDYALKPFQWTNENIDKPWAGFLLYAKERFQQGEQTVERAVKEEGFKKGLKAGYERAAIGTWGRFALEMSNPLWWIPASAWAGGAKLGLKALAGAEVADRTAAALALAAKTTTSAVTRPLMKVPYIRTMVAESPHSSVLNAAPSTYDVLENVSRVYGELGKSNIDVLADIAAGKLSVPIVEKGVIQSGRQVKVLDQLLSKQITNVRNGQTRDVASILKVDELLPLAKTDYQAAVRVLAGRMRQATSRALNVQNVAPGEGLLHNVYEFWRSGVLWTPAFMLQNAIENPIRTLIWTRRLPLYRGLADAAKEAGTPIQVQNLAQSASQYLHRGKTVGQTAAFLRRDIAALENQAKTLKAMKRPADTVEWRLKSLKEELAELPQAAADVNVAPILGTDAVIRSSGAMANTWERTLVGFFGKVLEAPTKPFTKGEGRERVGQAIRGGVRFGANFPHRVANYFDAAAMVRIYQHERGRFTKLLLKAEGPQKQELVDKFFADNAARWQKAGLTPEMVKGAQELAYGARNGAEFGMQWQRAGADLFPEVTDAIGKSQLPDDVKPRLIADLQNKIYAGDVDGIAAMVKEYKAGLQGHQREFAERWQADMRAAIDERLRLMAEPDRLQAQALFRGLEKQLDIGPETFGIGVPQRVTAEMAVGKAGAPYARAVGEEWVTATGGGLPQRVTAGYVGKGDLGPIGKETVAYGPDAGKPYQMRYRLVELDDLIPSHTDAFAPNPNYPKELQPRMRDRAAGRLWVQQTAKRLTPEAILVDTHTLDTGLPIVGPDGVVESGNGRLLSMRLAQQEHPERWAAYQQTLRDSLPQYGINPNDLAGKRNPVVVRERITPVDRTRFAQEANQPAVMGMSPLENAVQDAKNIRLDNLHVPEETIGIDATLRLASNRPFVRDFLNQLPANERGALVDTAGELNLAGVQRLKAALFAHTYQGAAGRQLTQIFFESREPIIRNVEDGMMASLSKVARAEEMVHAGARQADLSISEDLAAALDRLARVKQAKLTVTQYLDQQQMFERHLTPFQEQLLRYLDSIARSPKAIRQFLGDYADAVFASPPPQQTAMLAVQKPTKEGILNAIIKREQEGPLFAFASSETAAVTEPVRVAQEPGLSKAEVAPRVKPVPPAAPAAAAEAAKPAAVPSAQLSAEELGFEPEEALEQMLVWTRFNESAQQRQLIKQRFIVERLEKAAGKPEEWRELQALLDRLDQNITRPNRISHQQFGSVTSQVLPRGRITRIDWDSYIETVEKINPIFAMRLREMAPTRSNAWKNYRLGIADMFDNESLEIAAYLGVDDSLIQGGYVKRLLQQGQAELDDLEKMAQKIAAVPPAIDDKSRAMKDIELGVGKLFGENEDAILSTAALSNKASAMAESSMYAVMGNYGKTRGFDDAMRPVFPFFYFPSRSIPFYLRTGIEYPWTLRSYLTYEELTREPDRPASLLGYVKLGDGVYINPFRPWAGAQIFGREPLSGIGQPIAEQVSTALGMMGLSFQPGVTLGTEMASRLSEAIGGPQLTRGEPRPIFPQLTWMKAAAQAATGIPVLEPTQMMLGQAKWPAWYQRQIEKELANMGVDAARAMSSRATDEDKEAVQRAMKITGQKELTRAVAPIRFRHTKEIKMYAELSQALEAYGISKQQQAEIREQGLNPAQYLNNQQRRQMYQAHPDWEVWQGLTSPFLSMKEQQVWEQTRNFWLDYSDVADQLEVQQREDTKRVQLYQISKQEWRLNYQYRQQQKQAAYDMARRIYKGALVDNEAIDAYRREYGRPLPPLRMEDVAVQLYYDMNAPIDPVTRQPDFNELDARRDEFLDMLPPVIREYVIGEVDRPRVEADTVETEWRADRRRMKPWSQLRSQVVRTRPNWEAMLDNYAYARSADPPLADRIRKSGDFKGYQQALKRAREEMRMADAELEFLLIKWGLSNISKPLNPMTVQFIRRGY